MGSHDCVVSAKINLKAGVTEDDVKRVLKGYLKAKRYPYKRLQQDGGTSIDDCVLHLSIDVLGDGGHRDDDLDALVAGLCTIVEGRGYIEFLDFDTRDLDAHITPYFIGATEEDRELAKVDYGLMLMNPFVETVVGKEVFQSITDDVLSAANTALGINSKPAAKVKDSGQADTGIEAATLFMQELLDSVESLTELGDIHGVRTLASLIYLQQAILKGSFIDLYPDESKVLEVVKALPSHSRWIGFIELAKD